MMTAEDMGEFAGNDEDIDPGTGHPLGEPYPAETMDEDGEKPRKRGRPPGAGGQQRTVITTRQVMVGDGEEKEERDPEFSPLFDTEGHGAERTVTRVRVIRKEPDEGIVGYLEDPAVGEDTILARWGGGAYRLEGLNARGKFLKTKSVKIAGNPIFQSEAAEIMWRRSRGLPSAPVTSPGAGLSEILTMQQSAEDKRRAEEREHARLMRQLELDAEDRRRKEEHERLIARNVEAEERDKRRLRDEEERDRKRRLDDEERDKRRAEATAAALAQQQQFMQQTIAMIQASSQQAIQLASAKPGGGIEDTLRTIALIKDTFGGNSDGDGEESTMQTLFKNIGPMLQGAGNAVGQAIREVKGVPSAPMPVQQRLPASPGNILASLPADSPLATKLEAVVTKLAMQGKDPEAALSVIADNLLVALDGIGPGTTVTASVPNATVTFVPNNPPSPVFESKAIRIGFGKKAA